MTDWIIRQARVVDAEQDQVMDVAFEDGVITQMAVSINETTENDIDAAGLVLMPGGIDAHVHFNEPGRTNWEGIATGSRALAKGGMTSYFDMPLNSTPPTNTVHDYEIKRRLMDEKSVVNGFIWGGLTPTNLDHLAPLAEAGVIGFKAFMSNSGIDDFLAVDDDTLYRGMQILAPYGAVVAVHAENDALTSGMAQRAIAEGRTSVEDYLQSRPIIAEIEAIQRAILFAQDTGCKLHIVHVSSTQGVAIVNEARARGVDVTCETCPHYLLLTDTDVMRLGAVAKCAPPIRGVATRRALWGNLERGEIDFVASDHSPAPMALKEGNDFFSVWGGIAGCQSTLSAMISEGYHRHRLSFRRIVELTSTNVARRFGLASKGAIRVGMDADLVLIDLDQEDVLQAEDLAYKHKISPYVGMTFRGQIQQTWAGGKLVYG